MGQFPAEPRHDVIILFIYLTGELCNDLFHHRVPRTVFVDDGNGLPCIGVDAVVVGVHYDVEPANLIRPGPGLCNYNAVFFPCLFQKGVGMPADDEVHTPGRVQLAGKPPILFKADVSEQDRKINVDAVVGVADLAHLHRCGCRIYKGADEGFGFCLVDHVLCDDADEKDVHPIYL